MSRFWHALVIFGYALTIPVGELEVCKQLALPAVTAASLTNDLYSYEKEVKEAQRAGCHLTNGIDVIMREHDCDVEEAKTICQSKIKNVVASFEETITHTRSRDDLSHDLKRFIDVIQYSVSGNLVWSMSCPRYHADIEYNQLQSLREAEGVSKYPTNIQLKSLKRPHSIDDERSDAERTNDVGVRHKKSRIEEAKVRAQSLEPHEMNRALFGLQSPLDSPATTLEDPTATDVDTETCMERPKDALSDEVLILGNSDFTL